MILGIKFYDVSELEWRLKLRKTTIVCEKCGKVCISFVTYDGKTEELIMDNRKYCCLCLKSIVNCKFCELREKK